MEFDFVVGRIFVVLFGGESGDGLRFAGRSAVIALLVLGVVVEFKEERFIFSFELVVFGFDFFTVEDDCVLIVLEIVCIG